MHKDAQNSQIEGIDRKIALDSYCSESSRHNWVKPFYAKHTLEVDLFKEGNESTFIAILPSIYQIVSRIKVSETILKTGTNSDKYTEVLRLAKKEGKGWFALLLTEKITFEFNIPVYILDALKFCVGDIKVGIKEKILKYRLSKFGLQDETQLRLSKPDDVYFQLIPPIVTPVTST